MLNTKFNKLKKEFSRSEFFNEYGHPRCLLDQTVSEFKMLLDIYRSGKFKNILEIGQWEGGSLYYWIKYSCQDSKIIALDVNHKRLSIEYSKHKNITLITKNSQDPDTIKQVVDIMPEIDFLFIDGSHETDIVTQDFLTYGKLVRKGLIALHDINWNGDKNNPQGVAPLWNKIKSSGYVTQEFIDPQPSHTIESLYGIGLIYKGFNII